MNNVNSITTERKKTTITLSKTNKNTQSRDHEVASNDSGVPKRAGKNRLERSLHIYVTIALLYKGVTGHVMWPLVLTRLA